MTDLINCSFCNRKQSEVEVMIAGGGVFICDLCVVLCVDIIQDCLEAKKTGKDEPTPN